MYNKNELNILLEHIQLIKSYQDLYFKLINEELTKNELDLYVLKLHDIIDSIEKLNKYAKMLHKKLYDEKMS